MRVPMIASSRDTHPACADAEPMSGTRKRSAKTDRKGRSRRGYGVLSHARARRRTPDRREPGVGSAVSMDTTNPGSFLMRPIASAFCGTLLMLFAASALADSREEAKLMEAKAILTEWQAMPDQMNPERLLERGQGHAGFPAVVKAALFFGGKGGSGILVVRDAAGRWSSPSFVRVGGGSWGLQFGVETADVILV